MDFIDQVSELNKLIGQPAKIVWKDIKSIMTAWNFYTASDMSRRTGYSRQYIFKAPPIFEEISVIGKRFFRLKNDDQNRIFEHLKKIGFEPISKSIFRNQAIEFKFLDNRFVRISFLDQNTGLDFSIVADMNTSDLSKLSAQ